MSRIHALSSPDEYSWIFQNISAILGYFWKYLGQSLILNSHTTIDVEGFEEVET